MSAKAKFIRLPIAKFEALMRAGQMCSNVCFNLAQTANGQTKESMEQSRREWDAAASDARKQRPRSPA